MQANHPSVQGQRLFPAMVSIARIEGVRGLWRVSKMIYIKLLIFFSFYRVFYLQLNEQLLFVVLN
jgi:hypothetical protein